MNNISIAIESGNIDQVRLIIIGGIKFTESNSPLGLAAELGHLEIVRLLTDSGCKVEWGGHVEASPLYLAAYEGHLEIVEFLIERKAKLDYKDDEGCTPLISAAAMGHFDVVKSLVNAGAKINIIGEHGDFALDSALTNRHEDIYEYLLPLTSPKLVKKLEKSSDLFEDSKLKPKPSNELTQLIDAIQKVEPNISGSSSVEINRVIKLVSKVVDFQAVDFNGLTALHHAVSKAEVISILLENGYKIVLDTQDNTGETPLSYACISNRVEAVKILLEAGADTETENHKGQTALISTLEVYCSNEIIQLLFDAGVNLEAQDEFGNTSIIIAYAKSKSKYHPEDSIKNVDLLKSLGASIERFKEIDFINDAGNGNNCAVIEFIESKGNINCIGMNGASAVGAAALSDRLDTLRILLSAGAKTDNLSDVFVSCAYSKHIDIVQELINIGIDVNQPDLKIGSFAISRAVEAKSIAMVDILLKAGAKIPKKDPVWGDIIKFAKVVNIDIYNLLVSKVK